MDVFPDRIGVIAGDCDGSLAIEGAFMTAKDAPLFELAVATMVAVTSDKFGLPPTRDDVLTASGFPLAEFPDTEGAEQWGDAISTKFEWLFRSKATVKAASVEHVCLLIAAAFNGNDGAEAKLQTTYGEGNQ